MYRGREKQEEVMVPALHARKYVLTKLINSDLF